jgi:hypothetical protein
VDSPLYRARNPLGLKAYSMKYLRDDSNNRVFSSVLDGWQAGIFDLRVKCGGRSSDKRLKPTATLLDLMFAYGWKESMAESIAKFLRRALGDETISKKTPLGYFLVKE